MPKYEVGNSQLLAGLLKWVTTWGWVSDKKLLEKKEKKKKEKCRKGTVGELSDSSRGNFSTV